MRVVGLFVVLLLSGFSFGQRIFPTITDTATHQRILKLEGSAEIASTSLDNQLINRFLFGGEISNAVILENSYKQRLLNKGGFIVSGGIEYTDYKLNLFNSEKIGLGVQIGYDQIASLSYTDHLFDLIFKGNKAYANSNLDLTSTSIRNIAFQKVGAGLLHKGTKSALYFNFVNVSNYLKGGITKGYLHQSAKYDTLLLDAQGSFVHPFRTTFSKGMGFSVDFKYNVPLRFFNNDKAIFSAQIQNLGFAYMDGGLKKYGLDSVYTYTGFTVEQISDGILSEGTSVLDTLGIRKGKTSKWITLPFYVQLSKEVNEDYSGSFQSIFGLRVYPIATYTPLLYVGADYKPIEGLHLGLIATYGGFSTFRGSFYLQYHTERIGFGIGVDNVVGTVYKKGYGQTYNIQFVCKF